MSKLKTWHLYMWDLDWDLLSSYAGLLSLASISIYAGAHGSLPNPKKLSAEGGGDKDDEEEEFEERLSSEDAWLFPVIGSVTLCGLYFILKYFGKDWINWLLGWYFAFAGVGSLWKSLVSLTKFILGDATWNSFDKVNVSMKKGSTSLFSLSGRTPSLFLFPLAVIPSALFAFWTEGRKSILITNILSLSFSHNALAMLKIDSFKTGSILLSGLFFYDIWWVFGTEVMVKVATTLEVPIKLLWPKSLIFSYERGSTMLGLGDVVIPGTFIALALRYDYHRSSQKTSVQKPYFYASLLAYILGLVTTMSVMHVFGKAQPALLYLSPACIISFVMTATVRGELGEAWGWSDNPEKGEDNGQKEGRGKVVKDE